MGTTLIPQTGATVIVLQAAVWFLLLVDVAQSEWWWAAWCVFLIVHDLRSYRRTLAAGGHVA